MSNAAYVIPTIEGRRSPNRPVLPDKDYWAIVTRLRAENPAFRRATERFQKP